MCIKYSLFLITIVYFPKPLIPLPCHLLMLDWHQINSNNYNYYLWLPGILQIDAPMDFCIYPNCMIIKVEVNYLITGPLLLGYRIKCGFFPPTFSRSRVLDLSLKRKGVDISLTLKCVSVAVISKVSEQLATSGWLVLRAPELIYIPIHACARDRACMPAC